MKKAKDILKDFIYSPTEYGMFENMTPDEVMQYFKEALYELEVQEAKSCESCANYSNYNSHKAWECTKAHKFVTCGHAFEPPKNFCCNLHEPKATKWA